MKMNYKKLLAEDMISKFCSQFHSVFGVYPTVTYSFNKIGIPKVTLELLEKLINDVMKTEDPKFYTPKGIRSRTRKREVVIYRQIFLKIGHDIGYGPSALGLHIHYNHATAIHANKQILTLLETRDPLATRIYNTVINEYKKRFSNDGDVQQDSSSELNS